MSDPLPEIPKNQTKKRDHKLNSRHCTKGAVKFIESNPGNDAIIETESEELFDGIDGDQSFKCNGEIRVDDWELAKREGKCTICHDNGRNRSGPETHTSVSNEANNPMQLTLQAKAKPIVRGYYEARLHETTGRVYEQGKYQGHKTEFGFKDAIVFPGLHFSNLVGQPSTSKCTEDVADEGGDVDETVDGRTKVVGRGLIDGRIDRQSCEEKGEGSAKGDGTVNDGGKRD
jgi:hypothetical protein